MFSFEVLFFSFFSQNGMEGQYGEHYAQKVEDRLLHYLNELETMLPGKTHVDEVCVCLKRMSAWEEPLPALVCIS